MVDKKDILNKIINHYLSSHDYNGFPLYKMGHYDRDILFNLIDEGMIEVLSEKEVTNPHIKGYDIQLSIENQKQRVLDTRNSVVLYPSKKL